MIDREKKYILVLSGGGSKGFYALGILKALEESWLKGNIEAIFGVSAGAMLAAYRGAGRKTDEIFERFMQNNAFNLSNLKLPPIEGFINDKPVRKMFEEDLPKQMSDLNLPVYIWATDLVKGEYHLFHEGDLVPILMGSISLPVVFTPVKYKDYTLVDGGVLNNFPVALAKQQYPDKEVIGITMSKFNQDQKISSMISTAFVSFNLVFSKSVEENKGLVEHLFYKDTGLATTDNNKERIAKVYKEGYQEGLSYFSET